MARKEYQRLELKVRESASGPEYYVRYRRKVLRMVDGKPEIVREQKQRGIGLVAKMSKRQAERERDKIKAEVNGEVYVFASQIPFKDFIELYRKNYLPQLAVPTQNTYDQWLRIYIEPAFNGKTLAQIRTLDIAAFLQGLTGLADTTKNSLRGVLASVWKRAAEWGYWQEISPVENAKVGRRIEHKRKRRIWTAEELDAILAAVRPDVKLIIETLTWTGMRISECLGLTPAAFNLERGIVVVMQRQCRGDVNRPKSDQGRRVLPLGNLVDSYRAVLAGKKPDELIFKDAEGRPYKDCELLANYLTPILKRLELKFEGAGWHTLRRLHLSWFSDQNVSDRDLMDQAGHADLETTRLYLVGRSIASREEALKAMQQGYERDKQARKIASSGLRLVKGRQ